MEVVVPHSVEVWCGRGPHHDKFVVLFLFISFTSPKTIPGSAACMLLPIIYFLIDLDLVVCLKDC